VSGQGVDVVPRKMLDLCRSLLHLALAQLGRQDEEVLQPQTLREAAEHFHSVLQIELYDLGQRLEERSLELDQLEDFLSSLDDDEDEQLEDEPDSDNGACASP
jgi:hypothetical protein